MNEFKFMGRLTRDPEIRYSQTDTEMAIARFTLAVDRRIKSKRENEDTADFFNIIAFGKLANVCERTLHKGTKIVACGRVRNNNYTDKDGNKHYNVDFIMDDLYFCEKKSDSNPAEPVPDEDGFMNIPEGMDEELPFA